MPEREAELGHNSCWKSHSREETGANGSQPPPLHWFFRADKLQMDSSEEVKRALSPLGNERGNCWGDSKRKEKNTGFDVYPDLGSNRSFASN